MRTDMPIYRIEAKKYRSAESRSLDSWDLSPQVLSGSARISDFAAETDRLRKSAAFLGEIPVLDIVDFFDSASRRSAAAMGPGAATFPGISYLVPFLSKPNLFRLLKAALNGDPRYLDGFAPMDSLGKRMRAQPRGLVTHWLAGNIPTLGMISLVQGVLTKNANIVKLPRRNGLFLPEFFARIADIDVPLEGGRTISGKTIAASVAFVYGEPEDSDSQRALSLESDVRLVWGGAEAVNSVLGLPKKSGAEDILFGPRYSLAAIGREALTPGGVEKLAEKLAFDASAFDQHGCNSPHTVFVERAAAVTPLDFARALAGAMEKTLKRIPKGQAGAAEAYAVAAVRAEYSVAGEVFASPGTEWTVVYSEEKGLARPCGSRVVFIRPVADIKDIIEWLSPEIQTVGLALDEPRRTDFALAAARRGISRVTPIGAMSRYDYPWDGLFLMERFVRWVSLE
jgi:hypothetical protein